METLGQRMKRLRTEAEITQVHVSELIGVTRATVSQWESGVRHPSIKNLRKWCAALDVGVGEVLEGVAPEEPTPPGVEP